MEDWSPSFVVGIDFGMTCTGVAYSSSDWDWTEINYINQWPDKYSRLFDKYASRVGYDANDSPRDWGECNTTGERLRVERTFKLYLNPEFQDDFDESPTHDQAVTYYKHYMTRLRIYTDEFFSRRFADWRSRSIEYRFSIPTTWTDAWLTEQLKSWLAEAGFEDSNKRRIIVQQTEAEAAATYAAKHNKVGDVIMVVDAGGATTDVNVLEVEAKSPKVVRLRALDKAEGQNIGSVLIDIDAKRRIKKQLEDQRIPYSSDLLFLAERVMEAAGFENFKKNFDGGDLQMDHKMDIPGHPGKEVVLKVSELKSMFEPLISDLFKVIEGQLNSLRRLNRSQSLRYIVLSGGLGSSPYVQLRLREKYCTNTSQLRILVAKEPQLAVAKGLVMDRSQFLQSGQAIYTGRCCRVSYGVLYRAVYDRKIHVGQTPVKDSFSKKLWVENQIDWLIKSGEVVPDEGFLQDYHLKILKGNERNEFHTFIVRSMLPPDQLPDYQTNHDESTKTVCRVTGRFKVSDFAEEFELKRRYLNKDKEHYIADFKLRLIVGTTDLAFELVSSAGRRYSQNTARVQVEWERIEIPPELENDEPPRIYKAPSRRIAS